VVWILALLLLLLLWLLWFFLVPIDVSKLSVSAHMNNAAEVEATFPTELLGIVKPGQTVVIRLAGFPWTQYGTLSGTVRDAELDSNGQLLVKVDLPLTPESLIPVRTGLTGSAEVVVDHVSPAVLLLRALGQAAPSSSPSAENQIKPNPQ
jgi:hypothetical protein